MEGEVQLIVTAVIIQVYLLKLTIKFQQAALIQVIKVLSTNCRLDQFANLIYLTNSLLGEGCDTDALPRKDFNQSITAQGEQCLAHRSSAAADLLAELLFRESFTGHKLTVLYFITEIKE